MGVLLQAAYRQSPGVTVPSPADGDRSVPWWWDRLAAQANAFRLCGFSAILLPPVLKSSAGASPGADGYGTYDDYDLGNKNQCFSTSTRFGSRESLQRCVAIMRANGLDVYADVVLHQRDGGDDSVYEYLGADGVTRNGRFPKQHGCFVGDPAQGFVSRDPLPGPVDDDFAFGDELAPIHAVPRGYVRNGLIDAGDWLTRSLGIQGYRVDDVKGLAVAFVNQWLTSKSMANKFAAGEYYDGNPSALNWWVWASGMGGRCAAFDFSLHFVLQGMCNHAGNWDMSLLDHAGLAGISPMSAVTFIDNPDTDTDTNASVIWNKMLGYAYILTSEGYPCVYYKDYSTDPGCYGLKPLIDNLLWIHENLAFGPTLQRWKDRQCFVFERQGYPNLLVGMNNDGYSGWRTVRVQTNFGPWVQLHDYAGRAGDVWTDWTGSVTIGIPPNDNGMGYVCYSRNGYGQAFSALPFPAVQSFEGAPDLDIGAVVNGLAQPIGRVWCAANRAIDGVFSSAMTGAAGGAAITLELVDATGAVLASGEHVAAGANTVLHGVTRRSGWVTATAHGSGLPAEGARFTLTLTYESTQNP
jgi:alpha-amylase